LDVRVDGCEDTHSGLTAKWLAAGWLESILNWICAVRWVWEGEEDGHNGWLQIYVTGELRDLTLLGGWIVGWPYKSSCAPVHRLAISPHSSIARSSLAIAPPPSPNIFRARHILQVLLGPRL
jgi:hypothetical protein